MARELLKFKKVASTQDILKKMVDNGREIAVSALSQTQGRGRQKRHWFSPPGGLYLSIMIFPEKHINTIPLITAFAVIETLKTLGFDNLAIHWPNDVLLNNRKVCGILCETHKNAVICGIGLNVNIKKMPAKLPNATSLFLETDKYYDLEELLQIVLDKFWKLYDRLQKNEFRQLEVSQYLCGIGEPVEVRLSSKETLKGIIHNIDEDWALLLRTEEGFIRKIFYGDVTRLI